MFSPSTMSSACDSLGSYPASPSSYEDSSTRESSSREDNGSDVEFKTSTFGVDLLEAGMKEERFRIDRKKLEDMLQGTSTSTENADVFFQRVMLRTSTQISWPSKLKIGAKSKKDPHVKVVGLPENVQAAKELILEILDTKKNRVTLKMDVSHSDHSYIIGKGGFKIQGVMEETGCHIHFPDSNRNLAAEKSNQVSIAGQAAGVEQARQKIRDHLPLVFTFELPNGGDQVKPGDESSLPVQHIQQTYSFNVVFRAVGVGRTLLVVRGCQKYLSRLRQGLALLMEYLTGSKTIPVLGFMKTEIAAQHHPFVTGSFNSNIQAIMNKTGATIVFPTPSDNGEVVPNSPLSTNASQMPLIPGHSILRSKSTVFIQGSFDSVCMAWQELLKCLPLVLMFDLKEGQELDPVMVNNFMEAFNISIMVRPKIKENTKSVLIRGAEKDSKVLFLVRKDILGLEEDDSYPSSPSSLKQTFRMPTIEAFGRLPRASVEHKEPGMSTAESLNILSNIIQQNPQIVGLLNNLSNTFQCPQPAHDSLNNLSKTFQCPQQTHDVNQSQLHRSVMLQQLANQQQHINNHYPPTRNVENWVHRPDRSYAFSSGVSVSNFLQQKDARLPDDEDSGIFLPAHHHNRFFNDLASSSRPESSASSTSSTDNIHAPSTPDHTKSGRNRFVRSGSRFLHPDSQQAGSSSDVHELLSDYGNKKMNAHTAMQQNVDGVRTPNHLWSGYGFSKSMPDYAQQRAANKHPANSGSISEFLETPTSNGGVSSVEVAAAKAWNADIPEKLDSPLEQGPPPSSPFSLSNFWEHVPPRLPPLDYSCVTALPQLLRLLDLDKYADVFTHHEIDLTLFLTLTEIDLQHLNISYGARRKMLTAISAIREQGMGDWSKNFLAAPGAERRKFLPRYPSSSSVTDENNADRL